MERMIKIIIGQLEVLAQLNDSKIAGLIWGALPIRAALNTWGDEVYFPIPVKTGLENPVDVVEVGDLGYWPEGHAFCIFFGLTPISSKGEIRPASSVEIVGKVCGSVEDFKKVSPGGNITLERSKQ